MSALRTHLLGTRLPRLVAPLAARLVPVVDWRGPRHDADGASLLHLTFDDGPDEAGFPALLATLDRHGARATFFFLGERAARHPALVRAALDAGHAVGSHGWDHADPWRTPAAATLAGFARAETVLCEAAGHPVQNVRPPYGHVTPALVRWSRAGGRRLVLWDLMPGDFDPSSTPASVSERIVRHARPGTVVALHEGGHARTVTPAALALALPRLARAGWRFDTPLRSAPPPVPR